MKKWTVMLIPNDRGSTHTLSLSILHLALVAGLVLTLAFTTALFLRSSLVARADNQALHERYENLEQRASRDSVPQGITEAQRAEIKQQIRSEYEARNEAIADRLNELYDVEAQVRQVHGLPPRGGATSSGEGVGGGKGGGMDSPVGFAPVAMHDVALPRHLIYGLSRPSADLIVQEINIRTESLRELLGAMATQQDRVARQPSIWPTASPDRRITSPYGTRRDPFTQTLRHHDGIDIAAPYGSDIVATGRGAVTFSGYDRYLGHVVRVDHGDGVVTVYGHMKERLVREGDTVERGDVVGTLGNSGQRTTGPHLHYEVHVADRTVNPRKYFGD